MSPTPASPALFRRGGAAGVCAIGAHGPAAITRWRPRALLPLAWLMLTALPGAWAAGACDAPAPTPAAAQARAARMAQVPGGGMGGTGAPLLGSAGAPEGDRTPALTLSATAPGVGGTGAPQALGTDAAATFNPPGDALALDGSATPPAGQGSSPGRGGMGGTGIVGVITGFASICVNGLEVTYDPTTPLRSDGQALTQSELAVGQWVAVRASGLSHTVRAERVEVLTAALGTITAVDAAQGQLKIMGQPVQADVQVDLRAWHPGDWVRASGVRDANGLLHASHLDRPANAVSAQWTGLVSAVDDQQAVVDGLSVRLPQRVDWAVGTEVQVRGRWDGQRLHAQAWHVEPVAAALGPVARMVVDGYARPAHGSPVALRVGPYTLQASATAASTRLGQRVRLEAQRDRSGAVREQRELLGTPMASPPPEAPRHDEASPPHDDMPTPPPRPAAPPKPQGADDAPSPRAEPSAPAQTTGERSAAMTAPAARSAPSARSGGAPSSGRGDGHSAGSGAKGGHDSRGGRHP